MDLSDNLLIRGLYRTILLRKASRTKACLREISIMTPINIEIIMPMLTTLEFGCSRCGILFNQLDVQKDYYSDCCEEYPEEWKQEAAAILDAVRRLSSLYKHRLRFKLIDAQSPLGLWKQIRYRISQLPAFIVDRKHLCYGYDSEKLESFIDLQIQEASRLINREVQNRVGY